jgi:hypothetical protein
MQIGRITIVSLPVLLLSLASHAAFADSEDKKKKEGSAQPQAPTEERMTAAPPPAVGTTTTSAVIIPSERAEAMPEARSLVTNRFSMAPLVGMGTNHYNFGVGGRVGYTFDKVPIYVGGAFVWYHGDTTDASAENDFVKTQASKFYPAGEVGYDIGIRRGIIIVRPYAGAGVLFHRERREGPSFVVSDTTEEGLVYPGLTALINVPDSFVFLGLDTRLLVPVAHANLSYQGFFVAGLSM